MNKAIFLDRDGVINLERGYTHRLADFIILPHVFEMLHWFRKQGFKLIVISNQSGIAKKLYTQDDVETIHEFLNAELLRQGLKLDEIYYCIHHPDVSRCICRKPDSLFVEKALARFEIDPAQSFFIGDKDRDIESAEKAGVRGILIEANSPLTLLKDLISAGKK